MLKGYSDFPNNKCLDHLPSNHQLHGLAVHLEMGRERKDVGTSGVETSAYHWGIPQQAPDNTLIPHRWSTL